MKLCFEHSFETTRAGCKEPSFCAIHAHKCARLARTTFHVSLVAQYRIIMNYCSACGAPVTKKIPAGDNLPRFVCDTCLIIHYHNPKIVAGCIPEWEGNILLCRRAIEPRLGLWTFPSGFMEIGESTEEAAIRETFEEAQAQVERINLFAVLSLPHIGQTYLVFRGPMRSPDFGVGEESLEVQLFSLSTIPWDQIAFPVVKDALHRYVDDVKRGEFQVHVASLPDRLC